MSEEKKEYSSTYERLLDADSQFEKDLNKKYHEFILSELSLSFLEAPQAGCHFPDNR